MFLLVLFGLALLILIWFMVTQPLLFQTKQGLSRANVDGTRLETHVRMLSEVFVPRDYQHPENLNRVATYIREEFEQTKGRLSEQPFQVNGETYRNIILQFGPESGERVVVGAHYDALDEFPGADDNASGVAGLVELAHLLDKTTLSTTVELVAFTLEEPPFFRTNSMGSAVHAQVLREQDVPVRLMISLEMIGYFSDVTGSQHFPLPIMKAFYPSEGNFVAVIGKLDTGADVRRVKGVMRNATDLPVYSFNGPPGLVPGVDFSDHLNYWNQGYPAVMVTDTAFMRNLNYHTEYDTLEKLDYERMSKVVVGVYETILSLAE